MNFNKNLDLISKYLKSLSNSENERNDLYIFITENADQFLEISERMVGEVKKKRIGIQITGKRWWQ